MLNETFDGDKQKANKLLSKLFPDDETMRIDRSSLLDL